MNRIPIIKCRRYDCRYRNSVDTCERRWANGRRHPDAATAFCPGFIRCTDEDEPVIRTPYHPAQVFLEA